MSLGINTIQNRFSVLGDEISSSKRTKRKNNPTNGKVPAPKNQPSKNKQKESQSKNKNSKKSTVKSVSEDFLKPADEWVETDKVLVEKMFHDDVSKALELSKQEYEKKIHDSAEARKLKGKRNANKKPSTNEKKPEISHSKQSNLKEKKSTKTLSLQEFHEEFDKKPLPPSKTSIKPVERVSVKAPSLEAGDFFSSIEKEVSQIERQERNQVNEVIASRPKRSSNSGDRDVNLAGLSLSTVFDSTHQVDQRNERIAELEDELETWKSNYQQVKKRNRQLLVILQQGEMKDKVDLVLEVERLTQIRDELTHELSDLNENLEKERSKVSKLKDELKGTAAKKKPQV